MCKKYCVPQKVCRVSGRVFYYEKCKSCKDVKFCKPMNCCEKTEFENNNKQINKLKIEVDILNMKIKIQELENVLRSM